MRNSILAVVAVLSFAGCSGNGGNPGFDGGLHLDGGGNGNDFAMPDMAVSTTLIGCHDLLLCENPCTTQACITKCEKMATANAKTLLMTLTNCILGACRAKDDGGVAACPGTGTTCNDCFSETQSGTSPTGMPNGTCHDAAMAPSTAPVCGVCIDPLIACSNDATM